ncbi:MAG: prolipoprotein diacylglyceryl transferase [Deltaproteobacteria bacterium]|nr:prolipoprotein diacylglyceryl transferase [Deltaproteobacteria bacterium]
MKDPFSEYFLWNVDPTLIHLGSHGIRFYGVIFAVGILLGYHLWRSQMRRAGHDPLVYDRFLVWGVFAILIGARLGHCIFYQSDYYLRNPVRILYIWTGGLSSHGATIGLMVALTAFARRYRYSVMEILDRFAMSATMGAICVRLGNFVNGEIVGREWYGPWAVRFQRYAEINQSEWERSHGPLSWVAFPLPRHPSQLYEALGGLAVFVLLYLVDRRLKEGRPRGLMAGIFLVGYFSFRFLVEFFKEFQTLGRIVPDHVQHVLRIEPTSGALTMGQYLSIPFFLIGVGFITWALRTRWPAAQLSPAEAAPRPRKK